MDIGALYAMTGGTIVKLRLCAEKLATQEIVSTACKVITLLYVHMRVKYCKWE